MKKSMKSTDNSVRLSSKKIGGCRRVSHPKAKNSIEVPSLKLDKIYMENDENIEIPNTVRVIEKKPRCQNEPLSSRNSVKSSNPKSSRISHNSILNPVIKNGPISPEEAIMKFGNHLSIYELAEINNFQDIYFLGQPEAKIRPNKTGTSNYGYDDKLHHYKIKIGDHIAYRFEIRSVIGKGAFGQVLRCIDHKTSEFVALKIIVNTPVMNEQGQIEASILQYLKTCEGHENSCVIDGIDYFIFRNHICITSEILGSNLYDMCMKMKFKPLSLVQVRSISKDILTGLDFLHKNNVVHCDIKPENILLCPGTSKRVRIIDFGSSCMKGEEKFEYIQSRFYRAPEVILGIKYGPPMDIWSFGCIVVELLLGRPLFSGIDEPEQMEMYMEVFGLPPFEMIDDSPRRRYFFDENYKVVYHSSSRKKRRVGSSTLASMTKIPNSELLDLLSKCFEWDQNKRITASEALKHPFFQKKPIPIHNPIHKKLDNANETTVTDKAPPKKQFINAPLKTRAIWR